MSGIYGRKCLLEGNLNSLEESTVSIYDLADILESMTILENDDIMNEEYLEEGANIEYTKAFSKNSKLYKQSAKAAKKYIKEKKYKDAKSELSKMKKACNDIEKIIKETDSTVGSAVFGFFANELVILAKSIIPISLTTIGGGINTAFTMKKLKELSKAAEAASKGLEFTVNTSIKFSDIFIPSLGVTFTWAGTVLNLVNSIILIVKDICQIIKGIKENDKAENIANLYRGKLLIAVKDMRKKIDDLDKVIDKAEKEDKK